MKRPLRNSPYRIVRTLFGVVFLISIFTTLHTAPALGSADAGNTVAIISLVTSLTSLIGFLSTTALQWRRELRESREAERQAQRDLLEMEKLRLELEQLKTQRDTSPSSKAPAEDSQT